MEAKRLDSFLLAVMFLLASVSAYYLFLPISFESNLQSPPVGTMVSGQNVVKLRSAASPFWQDAEDNSQLTDRDMVYTHANASASIALLSGEHITLGERTLFQLDKDEFGKTELELKRGTLKATLSNQGIDLKMGNWQGALSGKGQEIILTKDVDSQVITPVGGKIDLKLKDQKILSISSDQQVILSEKKSPQIIQKLKVNNVSPALNQHFLFSSASTIRFDYQLEGNPSASTVQLSMGPRFKTLVSVNGKQAIIVRPGTYYWRVGNKGEWSNPMPFKVDFLNVPEILSPFPKQVVGQLDPSDLELSTATHQIPVHFSWKPLAFGSLKLELTAPDGAREEYAVKGNSFSKVLSQVGDYHWRLTAFEGDLVQSTTERLFTIKERSAPSAPQLLKPVDGSAFSLFSKKGMGVHLNWSYDISPATYHVDLFDQNDKLISTTESKDSHLFLPLTSFGHFSWKVRTKDPWGRELVSEKRHFDMRYLHLKSNFPQQGVEVQLERPDQRVKFAWAVEQVDAAYQFELAEDKEFKQVMVSRQVVGGQVELAFPKLGTYYWRTKVILSDGSFSFSEPIQMQIAPTPPPEAPELNPDSTFEIDVKGAFHSLPNKWRYLAWMVKAIFPSAHSKDLQTEAVISWKPHKGAAFYVLEIYTDEDGEKLLLKEKVRVPQFTFSNPGAGTYYWRLAIIDHWGRQGPFSQLTPMQLVLSSRLGPLEETELLLPREMQRVYRKQLFSWKTDSRVNQMIFQIARDDQFKKIMVHTPTDKNTQIISFDQKRYSSSLIPGERLFWRVIGQDQLNRPVTSRARTFIYWPPPKIVQPAPSELAPKQASEPTSPTTSLSLKAGIRYLDYQKQLDSNTLQFDGYSPLYFAANVEHSFSRFDLSLGLEAMKGKVFEQSYQEYSFDVGVRFTRILVIPYGQLEVGATFYSFSDLALPSDPDGDPLVEGTNSFILPRISWRGQMDYQRSTILGRISFGTDFSSQNLQINLGARYHFNAGLSFDLNYNLMLFKWVLDSGNVDSSTHTVSFGPSWFY